MEAEIEKNYKAYSESAKFIEDNVPIKPSILISLGSGLGAIVNVLENVVSLNYKDIPNFQRTTVQGHVGRLVFGTISNVPVVCMQGRFHFYEGYTLQQVTFPIRVMSLLGVKILIVTNAAGAVNLSYKVGDIMLIKDHINFVGFGGNNPLRGPNDDRFGPRFPPMKEGYNISLIEKAKDIACELGLKQNIHEGVYAMVGGPNYETDAETNALRILGADAVGMSTVPEVLVANHCGMKVFGLSLVTNFSPYEGQELLGEISEMLDDRSDMLRKLVTMLISGIDLSEFL